MICTDHSKMAPGTLIENICKARTSQHREEVRNDFKEKLATIEQAPGPLSYDNGLTERPFMVPLGHDTYDVWSHIIDSVTDPKDISSLREVCRLFREMISLERKYVQTQLPQIVQLILDKRPKYLPENKEEDDEDENEDELIRVNHSTSTLLDLRLISRVCKISVEKLLQQKVRLNLETTCWEKFHGIIDFMRRKEIAADMFFPSNLHVCAPWNDNNKIAVAERTAFFECIGILLERIGKRVKNFSYQDAKNTSQGVYDKLSDLVLQMPNLEILELRQFRAQRNSRAFAELPPFPNCPQLRSFIQNGKIFPKAYFQRILEANPHIRVVSTRPNETAPEEVLVLPELKSILQNVKCLQIPVYGPFFRYLELQLPLKEIVFHRIGSPRRRTFFPIDIFPFLHQFKDTLERLELNVVVEKTGTHSVDLPNLRFFKWEYNSSFQDLFFLLHAGRLEKLQMVVVGHYPNAKTVSDQFLKKVINGFDGLTLWEVFPRCNSLFIEFPYDSEKSTEIRRQ